METTFLVTGILIGFLGSVHCMGMCSPIAMAVNRLGNHFKSNIYNLGRVVAYVMIGLFFGMAGEALSIFGLQQLLSLAAGVVIISIALFPQLQSKLMILPWYKHVMGPLKIRLSSILKNTHWSSFLLIGAMNGFLPCGLVYVAVSAAVAGGNIINSTLVMLGFGIGTLPLMIGMGWGSALIKTRIKFSLSRLVPFFTLVIGIILIVRGLALDIPYLSPALEQIGLGRPITVCE